MVLQLRFTFKIKEEFRITIKSYFFYFEVSKISASQCKLFHLAEERKTSCREKAFEKRHPRPCRCASSWYAFEKGLCL